ncbi:hypothetical protein QUF90_25305 [Desulfococcaceae bacterium HSG9]|nr:hypothetical protein [Desulfococcaceae bacterium HSG9]
MPKKGVNIYLIFLLLALLLQSSAIILIKKASLSVGVLSIVSICANKYYLASIVCMAFQAIAWQIVLTRFPLALAYYFMSGIYIIIILASHFFFGESITLQNIIGTIIIIIGIYLIIPDKMENSQW